MSVLHVIILAAGGGTRMRSNLPKALLPLAGRPMLEHVYQAAQRCAPAQIHIVYGHLGEQVRSAFAHLQCNWVLQTERRGTGHAVQLALAEIPDAARVLILLGDVPAITEQSLQSLLSQECLLGLLTAQPLDPGGLGRVIFDGNRCVRRIVEEKDATLEQRKIDTVNTGIVVADAPALRRWLSALTPDNAQGELYLTDIFAQAAREGEAATAVPCGDAFEGFGANDPWQLAALERYYQLREVRALCQDGMRVADPARVDIRGAVQCEADVELDVGVILEGEVKLGEGVHIGAYSRVKDCTLAAGTQVLSHCDLDGVITTGACRIGPYARLRPGTLLASGAHIGNFVETKNAQFGVDSKANHLSYLGDTVLGNAVNVGAGTITCNYDGANKHQTQIGDGAFIGSNSALVAPVTIGANATIGAGSVISKDAPAGELTLARGKQTTVLGWQRPSKSRPSKS